MEKSTTELEMAWQRLESLVASLDCILYEIDPDTFRVTYVNDNAERILGYSIDEWLTSPTFLADHMHSEDREWAFAFCRRETDAGRNHQLELRMVAADGKVLWFRDVVSVVTDRHRGRMLRGVMVDITGLKRAEQQLRDREQHSRLVLETANDAFMAIDVDSRVTDWNRQAERIFGWSRAEAVAQSMPELIMPPRYREAHWRGLRRFLSTGEASVFHKPMELTAVHRDGHEFPVELTIWPVSEGGKRTFNAFVRDITRRKEGEDEVRRLSAGLQALSWRLLRVQEEERRRIANDLHDGALQMITAAQTYFETLAAKIEPDDPVLIQGLREYLTKALAECRNIIATMRPALLQDFGLVEGLRRYVAELSRRGPPSIEFRAIGAVGKLDDAVESDLFRIVQEGVTNAIRHSGSDRVRVSLRRTPKRLALEVKDWGTGVDVVATQRLSEAGLHIGLLTMRERSALVGGHLSLKSGPGRGTTVTVVLPLPSNRPSPADEC